MDIEQAEKLMDSFISMRTKMEESGKTEDIKEYQKIERKCIESFKYIVVTRTNRYKAFNNYEDLVQEGLYALNQAMKTYNPKKGIFFYWAHKYIDTRVARRANLHTVIRFPIKHAREIKPRRESKLPRIYDESPSPESTLESKELWTRLQKCWNKLPASQQKIASLYFGLDGKNTPVDKMSKRLKISQPMCESLLEQAISTIKRNIKL